MDPTQRFTTRVDDYVRYRPGYPVGVVDTLVDRCGLTPSSQMVDVGSGTGLLAELFLRFGAAVWGVEPNDAMRQAGERYLAPFPRFHSVSGRAEALPFPAASFDIVIAGQAAHWFEPRPAQREFARVLRPGGWLALIWNMRRKDATPFLQAYERVVQRYGTDYGEVNRRRGPEQVAAFFHPHRFDTVTLPSHQDLDWEGLRGRVASTSSVPPPDHPDHQPMMAAVEDLFQTHAVDGQVRILYDTRISLGQLG